MDTKIIDQRAITCQRSMQFRDIEEGTFFYGCREKNTPYNTQYTRCFWTKSFQGQLVHIAEEFNNRISFSCLDFKNTEYIYNYEPVEVEIIVKDKR